MIKRIADLLKHETAGDPMQGLKWIRKTTRKVARQLRRLNIRVSAKTVGRLFAYSEAFRTLIPIQGGHPFRSKADIDSDPIRTPQGI